jgi:hypothetical protein
MRGKNKKGICKPIYNKTPACELEFDEMDVDESTKAEQEIERLDAFDVQSCKTEFDKAVGDILKRYGCRIVIRGQFVGDKAESGIFFVKAK